MPKSSGGGIGSSISGTTQTAAASRIAHRCMKNSSKERRCGRGGAKRGGIDSDISSSSRQNREMVFERLNDGGCGGGGLGGGNSIASTWCTISGGGGCSGGRGGFALVNGN